MTFVSILISVLSIISLSWGAQVTTVTIGSNNPTVSFSPEWLKSQFNETPFQFVDVPFADVDFQLPNGTISASYLGFKRSRGAAYGVCIDCDGPVGGLFDIVDGNDPSANGNEPPVVLFKVNGLDPLSSHTITVFNIPDPRFDNTSQLTFHSLDVSVMDYIGGGTSSISTGGNTVIIVPPSTSGTPYVPSPTAMPAAMATNGGPIRFTDPSSTPDPPAIPGDATSPSGSTPSSSGAPAGSSSFVTGGTTSTLSSSSGAQLFPSQTFGTGPTTETSAGTLTTSPTSSSASLGSSSSSASSWGGPILTPVVSTFTQPSNGQASKTKIPTSAIAVVAILSFLIILSLFLGLFVLMRTRRRRLEGTTRTSENGPPDLPPMEFTPQNTHRTFTPSSRSNSLDTRAASPNSAIGLLPYRPQNPYEGTVNPSSPLVEEHTSPRHLPMLSPLPNTIRNTPWIARRLQG